MHDSLHTLHVQIHNSILSTVLDKTVFENNTGIKFFQTSISSSSQSTTLSITKYKCNADQSGKKKINDHCQPCTTGFIFRMYGS